MNHHANLEADRLNELLDDQDTGDAFSPDDTDALAATFAAFRADSRQARRASRPIPKWEDVMNATPVAIAAPAVSRTSGRTSAPRYGMAMPWLIAAVVVVVGGMFAGSWWDRQDGGPSEPSRFAALPVGTAEAGTMDRPYTPDDVAGNQWLVPVDPSECVADPMATEERIEILATEPDISNRSYVILGRASTTDSEIAVQTMRALYACANHGSAGAVHSLQSGAYIYGNTATTENRDFREQMERSLPERSRELSNQLLDVEHVVVTEGFPVDPVLQEHWSRATGSQQPQEDLVSIERRWSPDNVFQLEDGRLLVVEMSVVMAEDPYLGEATHPASFQNFAFATILINEDGEWKEDEWVYLCFETCDAFWARSTAAVASPVATPVD